MTKLKTYVPIKSFVCQNVYLGVLVVLATLANHVTVVLLADFMICGTQKAVVPQNHQ